MAAVTALAFGKNTYFGMIAVQCRLTEISAIRYTVRAEPVEAFIRFYTSLLSRQNFTTRITMTSKVKSQAAMAIGHDVELGSGNVFADLNLPDPEERQLRVQLAMRLNDLLAAEGLSQATAAKRMGIAQPHVSELKHYKLGRFSSERLLHYITLLNRDVEIFIRPRSGGASQSLSAGVVTVWSAA